MPLPEKPVRHISRPLFWCVLCCVLAARAHEASAAGGLQTQAQTCNERWALIVEREPKDQAARRAAWEREKPACAGTGIYEYWRATLLAGNKEFDEAITLLEAAQGLDSPVHDDLRVMLAAVRFSKADVSRPRDLAAARAANAELEAIVREKPDMARAVSLLASQRAKLEDFRGAEEMARRGLALEPTQTTPKAVLVVAMAATNRCGEAKPLMDSVLNAGESHLGDVSFMRAAAQCYLEQGDLRNAEQMLLALQVRVPEVNKDPAIRKLAAAVLAAQKKVRK